MEVLSSLALIKLKCCSINAYLDGLSNYCVKSIFLVIEAY